MDATAAPAPAHEPARFPCENCGAPLAYAPGADALKCPFCGHVNQVRQANPWDAAAALKELDFEAALRDTLDAENSTDVRVIPCTTCGAEVEFEAAEHAGTCPWCAAPLIAAPQVHPILRPRGVLPFLTPEREAHAAMGQWLGRLWFAPSGLSDYARKGRKMDGLYVPCWTFDADTTSDYRGQRGDTYYETQMVSVKTDKGMSMQSRQVPKIRWRRVSGRVRRAFDDILCPATRAIDRKAFERLGTWDLMALEPYDPRYLAGFRAEAHSIPLNDGYAHAREIMDQTIRRDVRFDIGGDRQQIDTLSTDIRDVTFKHILVPVWLAAYRYRGKSYRVSVNGRTGQVQGARPYSPWKIAGAVLVGLIVAAALGYLVAMGQK